MFSLEVIGQTNRQFLARKSFESNSLHAEQLIGLLVSYNKEPGALLGLREIRDGHKLLVGFVGPLQVDHQDGLTALLQTLVALDLLLGIALGQRVLELDDRDFLKSSVNLSKVFVGKTVLDDVIEVGFDIAIETLHD